MVGDHAAVFVDLDAIVDLVARARLTLWDHALYKPAYCPAAAIFRRRADAVGFHDMEPQGVGIERCRGVSLYQHEDIAAEKPGLQSELLQALEVIQPQRVAVLLFPGPQPELRFRRMLPLFRILRGKPQHLAVDGCFQRQTRTDDLGAVGVDGGCGYRRGHVEHSCSLAQAGIVAVDIFIGRSAVGNKPLERTPGNAGAGFAISLCLRRSGAAAVLSLAQCVRLL